MDTAPPTVQCPRRDPHGLHTWAPGPDSTILLAKCPGLVQETANPPQHPTAAIGRALHAQEGDVLTWGDETDVNARYRWDGERWQALQVGDVCRNARDGSAMIWAGSAAGWRRPRVSRADIDELAAVIDPSYTATQGDQSTVDATVHLARRILEHGYIHTLRAPDLQIATYHFPRVPYAIGDPVDVTWTNGRTTRHVIEAVRADGSLTLRNRS